MITNCKILYSPADLKGESLKIPFYRPSVSAGKPIAIDDPDQEWLDLIKLLVKHPDNTYIITASGDSMVEDGIADGDLLVVDRSLEPREGKIVILEVGDGLTVKKYQRVGSRLWLVPGNRKYSRREVKGEEQCHYWGLVTWILKSTS